MKKIILLLNLIAFTAISQVTPVGGYLPLNSSKSFTAGNATCSNVIARGTLSVGSTATVSGNALFSSSVGIGALPTSSLSSFRVVKGTSTIDLGAPGSSLSAIWLNASNPSGSNYSLYEDASNTFLNAKSGQSIFLSVNASNIARVTSSGLISLGTFSATGASTITGALTAQSTMSLGSANLTGGNTGTVAVLSDAVFPIQFFPSTQSPADGTTYYIGQSLWDWTWSSTTGRTYLPYNCTLVGANIIQKIIGTIGSAESVSISVRANNTTDYTLTTTETFSATNKETNITGLSHSLSANDAINVKIVCPTFATNPTNIYLGIVLWFVRRS